MNIETKLKIIVIGPASSGKTSVSNFLSDATENMSGENRPTRGVRIVEFLAEGLKVEQNLPYKVEVELWDCGGDAKYEACWPAILHKADGVLFVHDPSKPKRELEPFYKFFVEDAKFPDKNCLLLLNSHGGDSDKSTASPLPKLQQMSVNLEENGAVVRKTFNSFLSAIINRRSMGSPEI